MKPDLTEKLEARETKWTKKCRREEQKSKRIAQDGPRQRQRAAQEAQTGLWCTAGPPKWRPKSTKIDEKIDLKIDHFFDHFSYRFFFDFRSKNGRKMIEKSIKK